MAETSKQRLDRVQKIAYWREHIERCSSSSMSASRYCRQYSLLLNRFRYWQELVSTQPTPLFVEVETTRYSAYSSTPSERTIIITTPQGFDISIQTHNFEFDLMTLLNLTGPKSC
jgi:hypothetical protein